MTKKFTYWKDGDIWVGYIDEFPDYLTQGESIDELKDNLKDIFTEVTGGKIPYVRHTGDLEIA